MRGCCSGGQNAHRGFFASRVGIPAATIHMRKDRGYQLRAGGMQMNKKQIRKLEGKHIRIEPPALAVVGGARVPVPEPLWFVLPAKLNDQSLTFSHSRGYEVPIPWDHIREYVTDPCSGTAGILVLRRQLILSGRKGWFEPLAQSIPVAAPPPAFSLRTGSGT